MGKIIRNGIEFCGTSDTADNIIYDNKDSGLVATNTQTAIDELSEKVKSGGNVVYLTQAQYEALPDSKLTDDVEYRITDAYTTQKIEAKDITYGKDSVAEALGGLTESLTNENNESFNFGVLNGVRGFFTNPSRADDSFIPFKQSGKLFVDGEWHVSMSENNETNAAINGWTPQNGSYSKNDDAFTTSVTNAVRSSICYVSDEPISIQSDTLIVNVTNLSSSYPSYIGFSSSRTLNLTDSGKVLSKSGNAFIFKVLENVGQTYIDVTDYVGMQGYLFIVTANTYAATTRSITISKIKFAG